jgi:hypothetical protein
MPFASSSGHWYFRLFRASGMGLLACFIVLLVHSPIASGRPVKKMKVEQPLAGRLMAILVEAEALHRVLTAPAPSRKVAVGVANTALDDQIKVLSSTLQKAIQFSKLAGTSRLALEKILKAALARLKDAQTISKKNRKRKIKFLSDGMLQIIQIAQMYDLDHKYKIFFCGKDRAVWLQSSNKPVHPFDTDGKLKNCGMIMK